MPSRIAHIGSNIRTRVRSAVQGNDAGFVHHLLHDGNIAGGLYDLLPNAAHHGVDRTHDASRDTADVGAEVEVGIGFGGIVCGGFSLWSGEGLRNQSGCLAIRRIYNQRSLRNAQMNAAPPPDQPLLCPELLTRAGSVAVVYARGNVR